MVSRHPFIAGKVIDFTQKGIEGLGIEDCHLKAARGERERAIFLTRRKAMLKAALTRGTF
jgi:hypothetical protein